MGSYYPTAFCSGLPAPGRNSQMLGPVNSTVRPDILSSGELNTFTWAAICSSLVHQTSSARSVRACTPYRARAHSVPQTLHELGHGAVEHLRLICPTRVGVKSAKNGDHTAGPARGEVFQE